MTHKDYQLIARVLRFRRDHLLEDRDEFVAGHIDILAGMLATELGADDPRFDRTRFLEACGVDDALYRS